MSPTVKTALRSYPDLKTWRDAQHMSQHEAASFLGVSQKSYSLFERRERFVKGELAKSLMAKTGVPIEVLAGVA